jgi:hypothetical protein
MEDAVRVRTMKLVRLFNIQWDAVDLHGLGLPDEHIAVVEDGWTEKDSVDYLSAGFDTNIVGSAFKVLTTGRMGFDEALALAEALRDIGAIGHFEIVIGSNRTDSSLLSKDEP